MVFEVLTAELVDDVRRILVVDDERAIRELLELALSDVGYDVVTTCDAGHALEFVAREAPALIILDLGLPSIDGSAFARVYAELPGPHAPTIVISALVDAEERARAIGAVAQLRKPFDIHALLELVEQYAGEHRH